MKISKKLHPLLLAVILIQSVFILMSFASKGEKNKEEAAQSYRIEKKYYDGNYFYVLVSNGEAKAFTSKF